MTPTFGISIILGHPFEENTLASIGTLAANTRGVLWSDSENLHATLVNCTRPRARSVESAQQVLQFAEDIQQKLLCRVTTILDGIAAFDLSFQAPTATRDTVILPSTASAEILELKARMQGDQRAIPEERVPDVLRKVNCIGVDKFSTNSPGGHVQLRPTVSITLGTIKPGGEESIRAALSSSPHIPAVRITGIKLAFYRDRELRDATVSQSLEFEASTPKLEKIITEFFAGLAVS